MRFDLDPKIRATITPDRDAYLPGEMVMLHLRLDPEEDVAVRVGRVELIAWQRYRYQVSERDRHDDRYETRSKTDTEDWRLTDSILGSETLPAGRPVERWVRFALPRDAAPSGIGAIVQVEWSARATVDVPRRRDVVAEHPLRVVMPREAYAARVETAPRPHEAELARLSLDLPSRHAAAGQPFAGVLVVESRQDFSVRAVHLELGREEATFRELGAMAETTVLAQQIAGEHEFHNDQRYPLPFTLAVPADAMPSSETRLARVRWFLRATLDRPLRGDEQLATELNVFNAVVGEDEG